MQQPALGTSSTPTAGHGAATEAIQALQGPHSPYESIEQLKQVALQEIEQAAWHKLIWLQHQVRISR